VGRDPVDRGSRDLADDLKHHRKVAVKVLRPELAADVGAERFLREIETTASLRRRPRDERGHGGNCANPHATI